MSKIDRLNKECNNYLNRLQDAHNQIDSLKRERTRLLQDLYVAHLELEKRKVKKACGNCSGGCVASEVTGMPCSPKEMK